MDSLVELFVAVDDFWQAIQPYWHNHLLTSGERKRLRATQLSESEMITIIILFHQSGYRTFKGFYTHYVERYLRSEFPKLVSYARFVALMPRVGVPLYVFLRLNMGQCTGISFVDSTALAVCHNRRILRHRTFAGFAERGKSTMGWFYGFKLHLVVNDHGELLAFDLTAGNVDDREPLPDLVQHLLGKVFGDKDYLSQVLREDLREQGIDLITSLRRNMQPQIMPLYDKLLLRRRSIIETINDQLKNISQIEHSRHRSINNFFVNLLAGLTAYCLQPKKPSIRLDPKLFLALAPLSYP